MKHDGDNLRQWRRAGLWVLVGALAYGAVVLGGILAAAELGL